MGMGSTNGFVLDESQASNRLITGASLLVAYRRFSLVCHELCVRRTLELGSCVSPPIGNLV